MDNPPSNQIRIMLILVEAPQLVINFKLMVKILKKSMHFGVILAGAKPPKLKFFIRPGASLILSIYQNQCNLCSIDIKTHQLALMEIVFIFYHNPTGQCYNFQI